MSSIAKHSVMRQLLCPGFLLLAVLSNGLAGPPSVTVKTETIVTSEIVQVPTPAYARNQEVIAQVRQLVDRGDTEGLEALARTLRDNKERLDGGTWILTTFYDTASELPKDEQKAAERVMFFESWAAKNPNSITAQVCLADIFTDYAWKARGTGWANTVTEQGWRLMDRRLTKAFDILERAENLEEKCPGWFTAMQTVALGQNWSWADYMQLVNAGIAFEPTFGRLYTNGCYWMLPRWHGEVGDFEAWIAELADQKPQAERDRHYAFLVWMADRMPTENESIFAPGRLDWERTKRGFKQWLEEKPDNLMVRFEFLTLALTADDRETVRAQFDVIGLKFWPPMWSSLNEFQQARDFAYNNGPNPKLKKAEQPTSPRLNSKARQAITLVAHHLSGLIGGFVAGVFLLILAIQRRATSAGIATALASMILAAAFGTITALVPAVGLWLYLRRNGFAYPPRPDPVSGWVVLASLVGLCAIYLLLQIGAGVFATIPPLLEFGASASDQILQTIGSNGVIMLIAINASWITALALLVFCGPQNRDDWNNTLGLHSTPLLPALSWSVVALGIALNFSFLLNLQKDEKTQEALQMFAHTAQNPITFYLAIGLCAPIIEELIFRGYAYSGWIQKIGFWPTALATSLIFAGCHIQYGLQGLIWVFAFGLILSALRWITKSLYPCLAAHCTANIVNCIIIQFWPQY